MAKKIIMFLIRIYQKYVSPFFPPRCRFYPTCSAYTLEAVERYGAIKGGAMGFLRILRCNPFFKGGYDPVDKTELDYIEYKRLQIERRD